MVKVISMQNNLSFLKLCQIWKSDIFWRNLQSPPLVRISSSADFSFSHFSALEEDPLYKYCENNRHLKKNYEKLQLQYLLEYCKE